MGRFRFKTHQVQSRKIPINLPIINNFHNDCYFNLSKKASPIDILFYMNYVSKYENNAIQGKAFIKFE